MQHIRSQDTTIEVKLRMALWHYGLRYRKNYKKLIGKPDIVLPRYRIAIFCDSDYWHGYDWENRNQRIKSNREYWIPKIERNMARDKEVTQALQNDGWVVLRFWEWQIRKHLDQCTDEILETVRSQADVLHLTLPAGIQNLTSGDSKNACSQKEDAE